MNTSLFDDEMGPAKTTGLEVSPTVLKVDSWGRNKGRALFQSREVMADESLCDLTADEWADLHAAAFEHRPQLVENPWDQTRAEWFSSLVQTDEYRALHKRTRGRLDLSRVAALEMATKYVEYLGLNQEQQDDPLNVARSVASAVRQSRRNVDAAIDAMEALGGSGCGSGGGEPSELDAERIVEVFGKVRNDHLLRRIMDSAGKFRRVAQSLQRQKCLHGCDDMVGVTIGNKIPRLVHGEMANLCSEELEWLTLYRVANSRAMVKDYRGIEPTGKGPIVVVVDESSSMEDNGKIVTAKALALTLGWVAKQQRRWIAFAGFSNGPVGNVLALPPGDWDQGKLIDWLKHFFNGGTTIDVPACTVPFVHWPQFLAQGMPRGKTDMVIITDDEVGCPDEIGRRFVAWKSAEHVTAYGIKIGGHGHGSLDQLCDRTFNVRSLDMDSEAVREVLSV